jgi:hypothetical protein
MAKCETCGNDYDRPLEITQDGQRHVFDCFECAIAGMAPECAQCGTRVIGHGVDAPGNDGVVYCCSHCAEQAGAKGKRVA